MTEQQKQEKEKIKAYNEGFANGLQDVKCEAKKLQKHIKALENDKQACSVMINKLIELVSEAWDNGFNNDEWQDIADKLEKVAPTPDILKLKDEITKEFCDHDYAITEHDGLTCHICGD